MDMDMALRTTNRHTMYFIRSFKKWICRYVDRRSNYHLRDTKWIRGHVVTESPGIRFLVAGYFAVKPNFCAH